MRSSRIRFQAAASRRSSPAQSPAIAASSSGRQAGANQSPRRAPAKRSTFSGPFEPSTSGSTPRSSSPRHQPIAKGASSG